MISFRNCHHAIRYALADEPRVVGWLQHESKWVVYSPLSPAPEGCTPELLCLKLGILPLPLSEPGAEILRQMLARLD